MNKTSSPAAPKLNELEAAILAAHYTRDPNSRLGWYANGPGVPCFPSNLEVEVHHDRIRVFRKVLFGEAYTRRTFWDTVTVAVFVTVEEFIAACPTKSEGGVGPNVWD